MSDHTFDVVSLADIEVIVATPMSRNKKGSLIQNPAFTLREGDNEYQFVGRDVMWSYFDALFYGDPLPRGPVEDDLYAPTPQSPSIYSLVTDFTREAILDDNHYILIYHDDGRVNMTCSLKQLHLSNEIEGVGGVLTEVFDAAATYRPFKFRNRAGVHLRPSTHVSLPYFSVHIVDLGKRWYFSTLSNTSMDEGPIALHKPITIDKDKSVLSILHDIRDITRGFTSHMANGGEPPKIIRKATNESAFRTNEYHELLYLRWVKLGVTL